MRFVIIVFFAVFVMSCGVNKNDSFKNSSINLSGWWVYGEGYHSFMDEVSLKEYSLNFLNEDSLGLIELYLSVSEMEYFPMETNITGYEDKDTFYVEDFEITYIVGCDEQ